MKLAYNFFNNKDDLTMSVPNVDISFRKIPSNNDCNYVVYLEIEKVNESEYQLFSNIKDIYPYFKENNTSAEQVYKSIYDNLVPLNKYGIYHNDLNPGNLFIRVEDKKPYFKIIDFGNASFHNYYMRNSLKKYESLDSKNKSQGKILPIDFSSWIEGYTSTNEVDFSKANMNKDGRHFPTFGGSNHRTRKRKQKKKASRKKRSKKNRRSQKKNRKHRRQ